jgi:hypothetical protein
LNRSRAGGVLLSEVRPNGLLQSSLNAGSSKIVKSENEKIQGAQRIAHERSEFFHWRSGSPFWGGL